MASKKAFVITEAGPMVFDVNLDSKSIQAKLRVPTQKELEDEYTDAFIAGDGIPIAQQIDKEVNAAINETLATIKQSIKAFVMSSMGFSKDSWRGAWEVDHCNGRMSEISKFVSDRAKEIIGELDLQQAMVMTDKEKQEIRNSLHKSMVEEVKHLQYGAVREQWTAHLKETVAQLAKEAIEPLTEEIKKKALESIYGPK